MLPSADADSDNAILRFTLSLQSVTVMQLEPAVSTLSMGSLHGMVSSMDKQGRYIRLTRDCVSRVWMRATLAVAGVATATLSQPQATLDRPGWAFVCYSQCCMDVI